MKETATADIVNYNLLWKNVDVINFKNIKSIVSDFGKLLKCLRKLNITSQLSIPNILVIFVLCMYLSYWIFYLFIGPAITDWIVLLIRSEINLWNWFCVLCLSAVVSSGLKSVWEIWPAELCEISPWGIWLGVASSCRKSTICSVTSEGICCVRTKCLVS